MGFLVLLVFAGLLAVTVSLAVLLWRAGTWGRATLAAFVAAFGWMTYRAVEPEPAFYIDLFEYQSGISFPRSGQFLDRSASYPDNTGDFCAAALVAIDSTSADRLRRALDREARVSVVGAGEATPLGWCGVSARGSFRGALRDSKDGRALWWGLSGEEHLVFQYVQM